MEVALFDISPYYYSKVYCEKFTWMDRRGLEL
jgi:hypothetical protein